MKIIRGEHSYRIKGWMLPNEVLINKKTGCMVCSLSFCPDIKSFIDTDNLYVQPTSSKH